MKTAKEIIKKQDELIEHYRTKPLFGMRVTKEATEWIDKRYQLESELSALKSQMEDITDEEIEKWARKEIYGDITDTQMRLNDIENNSVSHFGYRNLITGAKAMRDGLIKHK